MFLVANYKRGTQWLTADMPVHGGGPTTLPGMALAFRFAAFAEKDRSKKPKTEPGFRLGGRLLQAYNWRNQWWSIHLHK